MGTVGTVKQNGMSSLSKQTLQQKAAVWQRLYRCQNSRIVYIDAKIKEKFDDAKLVNLQDHGNSASIARF